MSLPKTFDDDNIDTPFTKVALQKKNEKGKKPTGGI